MTTCQFRKCRDCNYFQPATNKSVMGWCYWKGLYKNKNKDEDIKKVIHYAKLILQLEYGYDDALIKEL